MSMGVLAPTFSAPPSLPTGSPTLSHRMRSGYNKLSEWTFTHSSKMTAALQTLSSDLPMFIPHPSVLASRLFSLFGLGASVIDCLVEPYGIGKNFKFLSTHSLWKKPKADLCPSALATSLQNIQTSYFEISQEKQEAWTSYAQSHFPANSQEQLGYVSREKGLYLQDRKLELGKCMGHHFADTLQTTLPDLLQKLHTKKPAAEVVQEARDLLNKIRLHAYKSSVIRLVGLIGAVLTALFFIFTGFALLGGVFPLVLAGVGSLFYLVRFTLAATLPEINGWRFSLKTAVHHTLIEPVRSVFKRVNPHRPYLYKG